jgi:uncharacterized membrane protein YqjE/uncharacterized protein YjbJ (UPF0337 family)
MEGARDFRREEEQEDTADFTERAKEQVSKLTDRAQQAAQGMRERVTGARQTPQEEEEQEPLTDQLRRGQQEAKEVGRDVADVIGDLGTLVQQEVRLAKAEMSQQVSKAVRSVIFGSAAGLFAGLMLVFLFVAVMLVLGELMALWIAALVTTGILLVLAAVAGLIARQQLKKISLTPVQTIESVKEDLEWARNQMKSGAR